MTHKKFDDGKVDLSLFPMKAMKPCCEAWQVGAVKYGRRNWEENDIEWDRTFASILRHLTECQHDPVTKDPETGISHLAHAATQILMKLHFIEEGQNVERFTKEEE